MLYKGFQITLDSLYKREVHPLLRGTRAGYEG